MSEYLSNRQHDFGGPDLDPDPVGLTPGELLNLQADVNEAISAQKVVVIAVYILPNDCIMGSPSGSPPIALPPNPPPQDGLNGVPPGHQSLVYRFPLVTGANFTADTIVPKISKRFQRASEMQAIVATSNSLYVKAVASFEGKNTVEPGDNCPSGEGEDN